MANVYMGTDVEDFIFGESTYEEACKKEAKEDKELMESIQADMDATGVLECVDEPEVACYRIALENEMNYNMIMNAMMTREYSVLESTGVEMVYEAANVKEFFNHVEQAVLNFWKKIKGVFRSITEKIAATIATNKAFIKKYKGESLSTPSEKFKGGYKFTNVGDDKAYEKIVACVPKARPVSAMSSTEAENFMTSHNLDSIKGKMRGAACGSDTTVDGKEFAKKLKVHFYGSEKKEDIALPSFGELISELENANEVRKGVKGAFKSVEKAVKEDLKTIRASKKEVAKDDESKSVKMNVAKAIADSINASTTIMNMTFAMQTRALIAKMMQDRAMATFYVTHQAKKEEKVEHSSASMIGDIEINLI